MADQDIGNTIDLLYQAIIDEVSFKAAEDRSAESARKTTAMLQTEFQQRVRQAEQGRREGERIAAAMSRDEQAVIRNRAANEQRQLREAQAIRRAMLSDEAKMLAARNRAEKDASDERIRQERYETQARESLQRQRSSALIRIAREEQAARNAGQTSPAAGQSGLGRMLGLGQGSNFALRRSFLEAGAVTGLGPEAGVAALAVYGPQFAALAAIIGTVGIAVKTVKDALADQESELKFAAAIRTVGQAYSVASSNAQQFHQDLIATREESRTVAAAFARVSTELGTSQSDIKALSTIATAKGQTPEELARVLDAIRQGNRDVFETETGLKAQVVIDEYAKSIGKLPGQLNKAQEAQALYNKYLQTSNSLEDLATAKRNSASGQWERLKNAVSDFSSRFGQMLLSGGPSTPGAAYYAIFGGSESAPPQTLTGAEAGAIAERDRQRELERRYETAQRFAQVGLKGLDTTRVGETPEDRLKNLMRFRDEFRSIASDLDAADPRIQQVTDDIEKRFSQAFGTALASVQGLAKTLRGSTGEFAVLTSQGEKNPFLSLLIQSEDRARKAQETFRLFGDEVVQQYQRMAKAADEAARYDLRVTSSMKAVALEFEEADLKKPFTELTGEMKRSLSVLQAEIGAAVRAPGLLTQATAIDLYSRFQTPRANERSFGLFDVSETSQTFAQGQEYDRLRRLNRTYGLDTGRGGEESRHIIDLEMIRLFGQLDPRLRSQILQGQRRGEFSDEFGGAFRREAAYSESGVERAIQTAEVGRRAVNLAQAKLADLDRLRAQPGADRDRTRAEYLAITGALPREELTPTLLKGRIDALRDEAVFQRAAEQRAQQAFEDARKFQTQLIGENGRGGALGQIRDAIKERDEQVTLRVLDEDNIARVSSLGKGYQ
jgi:hypothetical protein